MYTIYLDLGGLEREGHRGSGERLLERGNDERWGGGQLWSRGDYGGLLS